MSDPAATLARRQAQGRQSKRKGATVERDVAKMLGGKRMVMSGGSHLGGGDISLPSESIFHDFLWEVKARKKLPEIVKIALTQAEFECQGSNRRPAGVVKPDGGRPVVYLYLDDFVQWANALAEMGQGQRAKAQLRIVQRALDELKGML